MRCVPRNRPESWTWQRTWELLDRADRLNRHFSLQVTSRTSRAVWEPPVDVFETATELWVVVALPGVRDEAIELVVEGGGLVVAGERSRPGACERSSVRHLEIPRGRFERRVVLPAGRYRVASRELVDGCLVVALSKLR